MDYTEYGQPTETFEDVIQELTDFKNCALDLSDRYKDILKYDSIIHSPIESKLQRYLKYPKNIQTLQSYIKVLERITDKKIREALPVGSLNDSIFLFFDDSEESKRQEEERVRQEIKDKIKGVIAFIKEVLNRYKVTSIKTKYFDNPDSPKITARKLRVLENELKKNQLIICPSNFVEIFRGQAPDERINWIGGASSFRYFIKKLFDTDLLKNEKQRWVIASNTFSINGNPVPTNIRTYKNTDVNRNTQKIINDAISRLTD